MDDSLLGVDSAPPYSVDWDTARLSNGRHVLRTRAVTVSGNFNRSEPLLVTTENPGAGELVNGGFEQGFLGWDVEEPFLNVFISDLAHSGRRSLQLRSTGGTGLATQSFGVPLNGGALSLWYRELNCTRSGENYTGPGADWTPVTFDLTPMKGHRVEVTLSNPASFAGTRGFFDDVRLTPILNPGFEDGFFGWSAMGAVLETDGRTGRQAARLGSPLQRTQNTALEQTFVVPSDGGVLSFWYKMTCPDTVADDWFRVTLRDNSTRQVFTVLDPICATHGDWVNVTYDLDALAGRNVSLGFFQHDDLEFNTRSFTLVDDVFIQ